MKLKKYALIAEIVGGVAIVLSLLYVGYEVAQNTAEVRATNRQSTARGVQDFALAVATTSELAEVVGFDIDPESLTETQQVQLNYFNVAFYRSSEEAYLQYLDGLLSEDYWSTRAGITIARTRAKSGQWYWERSKTAFSPKFVEWVDGELLVE